MGANEPKPTKPSTKGIRGGGAAGLGPIMAEVAHRSPIQPALQRVHLPVTWLQACPSRHGGQRWLQPSP